MLGEFADWLEPAILTAYITVCMRQGSTKTDMKEGCRHREEGDGRGRDLGCNWFSSTTYLT